MKRNGQWVRVVAWVMIGVYGSFVSASSVAAAEIRRPLAPIMLAQALTSQASAGKISAEEERALRQIYDEKIQRLEGEMNNARGTRNTLLTVSVASFFLGGGILAGSNTVSSAIDKIEVKNEMEADDKEDALTAIDAMNGIGGGILAVGGVSLAGYVVYSGIISAKQQNVDQLRDEVDARFATRGLTPEYLQRNEAMMAVLEEIAGAKKSAGTARSAQGFFSRVAIGSLLSGGLLFTLGAGGENVIDEVNINEDDPEEVASRQDALDEAETIKTTGLILAGTGAACGIVSFIFSRRATGKEHRIDELENSLLRVASRLEWHPKRNGFALVYNYTF